MKEYPQEKLFKIHNANLIRVGEGLDDIARDLRKSLALEQKKTSKTLTLIYALLVGAWSECRLLKLIYESGGFSDKHRSEILGKHPQIDRWMLVVELGFRQRYKVPRSELRPPALPRTAYDRYILLNKLVNEHLRPIIEIRNRLAPGQWERALTTDNLSISEENTKIILNLNFLQIKYQKSIMDYLCRGIHDLISTKAAFERDFDKHFNLIENTFLNMKNRKFSEYEGHLIKKYRRGISKRDTSIKQSAL